MTSPRAVRASPARVVSVDFWRGIALAIIFIDHMPGGVLARLTPRNFGFSDAAEIFVFLAGIAASFAYFKRKGEVVRDLFRVSMRAFTLYTSHIVVLVLCGGIIAYTSLVTQDPRILEMMQFDLVTKDPVPALVGIATLTFQPSNLNILPLYVVLLSLAPIMILLVRRDMRLALIVSGSLYLATQLFGLTLPSYPNPDAWFFNPLAWQFLFTLGLCCGMRISRGEPVRSHWALNLATGLILLVSLVVIHGGFVGTYDLSPLPRFLWEQDKTNLSLPRLLHFAALVYLVTRLPIESWISGKQATLPLIFMGRHSLPVFSLGVVLAMVGEGLKILYAGSEGIDVFAVVLGLGLQIGLAWTLEWQRTGQKRAAATADPATA